MDIRKCLVVGRQRALRLLPLVVSSAAEMGRQRSSRRVLGHAREPRCRRGDGNGLPSASSVFGCWLEEEGNGWDCEREREKREDLSSPPQQRPVQLGGNRTDANFLAHCWGALSLLFRHRFSYSRLYRFVFLEEEGLALLFSVDLFVFDSLCLSTGNSIYSCFLLH
jgi:hypothetical protein